MPDGPNSTAQHRGERRIVIPGVIYSDIPAPFGMKIGKRTVDLSGNFAREFRIARFQCRKSGLYRSPCRHRLFFKEGLFAVSPCQCRFEVTVQTEKIGHGAAFRGPVAFSPKANQRSIGSLTRSRIGPREFISDPDP